MDRSFPLQMNGKTGKRLKYKLVVIITTELLGSKMRNRTDLSNNINRST